MSEEKKIMSEWQPIETVPRDGTSVLVHCPRYKQPICLASWLKLEEIRNGVTRLVFDELSVEGGLFSSGSASDATHWMPLPVAPLMP